MEYLVIDGYNVINSWNEIFDLKTETLEECRIKLARILSSYQGYNKANIIIVFDAHLVKGSREKNEAFDNLQVVFTKENETADNYIERFVYKLGNVHNIKVVTLDYLEQRLVLYRGGIRMSPAELLAEIRNIGKNVRKSSGNNTGRTNTIMSRLDPELFEILDKIRRDKF